MMSTYSRPAWRYNRMLRKLCPKNPNPSRKRKMVMSARTTMAMSALLPKKAFMKSSARQRRTAIGATIGGAATTSAILQSWRLGNGGGKCRSVTFALQLFRKETASVSVALSDDVQLNILLDTVLRHDLNDLRYSQVIHILLN